MFSDHDWQRVAGMVQRVEGDPIADVGQFFVPQPPGSPVWNFVKITGPVSGSFYPGSVLTYQAGSGSWSVGDAIWVATPNGGTLAGSGVAYIARLWDNASGRAVYMADQDSATLIPGLMFSHNDGTPTALRPVLNFVDTTVSGGINTTFTVVDNPGNDSVDVTQGGSGFGFITSLGTISADPAANSPNPGWEAQTIAVTYSDAMGNSTLTHDKTTGTHTLTVVGCVSSNPQTWGGWYFQSLCETQSTATILGGSKIICIPGDSTDCEMGAGVGVNVNTAGISGGANDNTNTNNYTTSLGLNPPSGIAIGTAKQVIGGGISFPPPITNINGTNAVSGTFGG